MLISGSSYLCSPSCGYRSVHPSAPLNVAYPAQNKAYSFESISTHPDLPMREAGRLGQWAWQVWERRVHCKHQLFGEVAAS
jgi:hypothetical protein